MGRNIGVLRRTSSQHHPVTEAARARNWENKGEACQKKSKARGGCGGRHLIRMSKKVKRNSQASPSNIKKTREMGGKVGTATADVSAELRS